jgi:replicative DNA helicase
MMMELSLIKTLMNREFFEENKGGKCPQEIFTKDTRKIKAALDSAMDEHDGDISVVDLQALFYIQNSSMTTSNKAIYADIFSKLEKAETLKQDIAHQTVSRMFQQYVGEKIANLGFDYVNGTKTNLEDLRQLLERYEDNFTPTRRVKFENKELDHILQAVSLETQWKFNIPSLRRRVEGVNGGHLLVVGARPNTGKTSFAASIVAGPDGWARQGAKCISLLNEESYERVVARYISAATDMTVKEIAENPVLAAKRYSEVKDNIDFKECSGMDMDYVEMVAKSESPDIIMLDMGDKFAKKVSDKSDVYLKEAAIHARNIAKKYKCCVVWMSQLSADAEGKRVVDMSMMEGSKTGKAAEADLMILLSKNPQAEGEEESSVRNLNVAKNKITGWHGLITCELDHERGLYTS